MTDFELLHEYASNRSEQAFGTVVERYANLVFSAALRQVRNPHDAEEISQAVFTILARKAGTLHKETVLSGWLVRTTRFVVLNSGRREINRRRAEMEAASQQSTETESAWEQIGPLVDEALVSLNEGDRNALTLRFFEQKSFKEIAGQMRTSEDAAQKRVSRALDKLRSLFAKRGLLLNSALVSVALATKTVQAAPSHLASAIVAGIGTGTGPSVVLAEATLRSFQFMQIRSYGLGAAGASLVLVVLLFLVQLLGPASRAPAGSALVLSSAPAAIRLTNAAGPSAATRPNNGLLLLRVLDSETGTPLRRAGLTVTSGVFPDLTTNTFLTDEMGGALVPVPSEREGFWYFRIAILRDGFVPRFVSWAAVRGDSPKEIPAEYTVRLMRGLNIGGMVVDEQGQPVPDVVVALDAGVDKLILEGPPEREGLTFAHEETTDGQGRWMCNHAPENIANVSYRLSHPGYIAGYFRSAKLGSTTNWAVHLSEDDFRNQCALMFLKAAVVVTGVDLDEQGNPIAVAKATQNHSSTDKRANQLTSSDGTTLQRTATTIPARISGTVVDVQTKAPIDDFEVWGAVSYRQAFASGLSHSVMLSAELRTTGTNGRFAFLLPDRGGAIESCEIEIRAESYLPARERVSLLPPNLPSNLVMALERVSDFNSNVKLPDGTPAAGAVVIMCSEGENHLAYMHLPGEFDLALSRGNHTETDPRGEFRLPRPASSAMLFVAHKFGYAKVKVSRTAAVPEVMLLPWSQVRGTFRIGNRPAANRTVSLENLVSTSSRPFLQIHLAGTTDNEGSFVIQGVPPGEWKLWPHGAFIQVGPGATAHVSLGGAGYTVIGRLAGAENSDAREFQDLGLVLSSQLPGLPQPTRRQFAFEAEYIAAKSEWVKRKSEFLASEPGCNALREYREYTATIAPDGSFKVEEALPGNYELRFRPDPLRQDMALIEALNDVTTQVVLPEPVPSDARIDVGVLSLPDTKATVH